MSQATTIGTALVGDVEWLNGVSDLWKVVEKTMGELKWAQTARVSIIYLDVAMHGRMPKTQNISRIMESWKEEQLAFYRTQIGIYQMTSNDIHLGNWYNRDTGYSKNDGLEKVYLVQKYDYFGYLFLHVTGVALIISYHDIPPQCQPWHHRFLPLHVHLPQSPASWGRGAPQLKFLCWGNWALGLGGGRFIMVLAWFISWSQEIQKVATYNQIRSGIMTGI